MTRSAVAVALVASIVVGGCGDDGGGATDGGGGGDTGGGGITGPAGLLDGHWRFVSMTREAAGGGTETLTPDSSPTAARGYEVIRATSDSEVSISLFLMELPGGVPVSVPSIEMSTATVDETHILSRVSASADAAFAYILEGEQLTATHDPDHPANTVVDYTGPTEVVLSRVVPERDLVGNWDVSSFDVGAGPVATGECVAEESGFARYTVGIDVDEHYLMTFSSSARMYDDAECTNEVGAETDGVEGFFEQDGTAVRLWAVAPSDVESSGQRLDFTMAPEGDGFTLTRTDCIPMPSCASEAPSALTLVPSP